MATEEFFKFIPGFSLINSGSAIMDIILILMIVLITVIIIGGFFFWIYNRKKWNLKVEFKLPRAVQQLREGEKLNYDDFKGSILTEWGKGFYNIKKGVVFLKRKGKRKIAMKPFRVTKFLQDNFITVVQIGADEYLPIAPESFILFTDDETGEQVTVLEMKTDSSESKAWKENFERTAKNTYSITDKLAELLSNPFFLIGIVIFLWGLQFLLLYNKIGK